MRMMHAKVTFGPAVLLMLLAGCRVESQKGGEQDDVKIATPFGGVSVKTKDAAVQGSVGIAMYPGAMLVHQDKDDSAADVNLSFGDFHLGVKALSYHSGDAPEKVMAFYRKDLARYGVVIQCKDHKAIGSPARTQDGLGCDKNSGGSVQTDESGNLGELKAASKQHEHVVTIDRDGAGTKFGLVALDLPGHMKIEDDRSKQ